LFSWAALLLFVEWCPEAIIIEKNSSCPQRFNQMFSDFYAYPIPGKSGLPLCQEHGRWLELKEAVLYDEEATWLSPPNHCWVYGRNEYRAKIEFARLLFRKSFFSFYALTFTTTLANSTSAGYRFLRFFTSLRRSPDQ
jgi:hypothetical protein